MGRKVCHHIYPVKIDSIEWNDALNTIHIEGKMKIRIRSAFSGWMRIWRMWSDSFVQAVAIKTKIHILPHLLGLVRIFLCGFDLFLLASLFASRMRQRESLVSEFALFCAFYCKCFWISSANRLASSLLEKIALAETLLPPPFPL